MQKIAGSQHYAKMERRKAVRRRETGDKKRIHVEQENSKQKTKTKSNSKNIGT